MSAEELAYAIYQDNLGEGPVVFTLSSPEVLLRLEANGFTVFKSQATLAEAVETCRLSPPSLDVFTCFPCSIGHAPNDWFPNRSEL
jgi:hypothetical protein